MKNRLLLLVLAAAFVLGTLVGCTNDDDDPVTTGTETETENTTDTGDQPTDTGDQPTDTGDQPTDTGDQPTDTGDQPTDTGDQPTDTGDQPTDTGDQPTDTGTGTDTVTDTGDQPTDTGTGTDTVTDTGDQPTDTGTGTDTEVANDCLIISEYIEGSSNNKGIELYNCGDAEITLAGYTLCLVGNDDTACTDGRTLALTGTLSAGSVYTICHASVDTALYSPDDCDYVDDPAAADGHVTFFNGDDRIDLQKDGVTVDAFGQLAVRPASEIWREMTLRRCDLIPFLGDSEFNYYDYYNPYDQNDFTDFGFAPSEAECVGMPEDTDTQDTDTGTDTQDTDTGTDTGNEPVTIMEIQDGTIAEGQVVTVENVVVTSDLFAGGDKIYVQDPAGGEYSGILVYRGAGLPAELQLGDLVNVTGEVTEYFGLTELEPAEATDIVVVGTSTVPDPVVVAPADVATSGSLGENYESVLIQVQNVVCTDTNPDDKDPGEWLVTGDLRIDTLISDRPDPLAVNDAFESITGILNYDWNNFKLAPRSADDIVPATTP